MTQTESDKASGAAASGTAPALQESAHQEPALQQPDYSVARPDETWIDRLSRRIGDHVAWFFLLAALLTCVEVVSDAFFDSPTIWVHDSTIMLCASAFLIGGAYAMQRDEHIRINVVYDLFGPRMRWFLDLITYLLSALYLAVLSAITGVQAAESIRLVERGGRAWDFPMPMVVRTMMFIGAALLLLQCCSSIYRHWRGRKSAR